MFANLTSSRGTNETVSTPVPTTVISHPRRRWISRSGPGCPPGRPVRDSRTSPDDGSGRQDDGTDNGDLTPCRRSDLRSGHGRPPGRRIRPPGRRYRRRRSLILAGDQISRSGPGCHQGDGSGRHCDDTDDGDLTPCRRWFLICQDNDPQLHSNDYGQELLTRSA